MSIAVMAMSHAPLYVDVEPDPEVRAQLNDAFGQLRRVVESYRPDLVVMIGPDHFTSFFYDMMPQFCVASAAQAIGDWGADRRELPVDRMQARSLHEHILQSGVDCAISEDLWIDHGSTQSLEEVLGKGYDIPIIPIVVNTVGIPLGPMDRLVALGRAIGTWVQAQDQRVLVIGSGGLSHDPPVPRLVNADERMLSAIVPRRVKSVEEVASRRQMVIDWAAQFQDGSGPALLINPALDAEVMDAFSRGDVEAMVSWSHERLVTEGGCGMAEVRSWVAAFSALSVAGPYEVTHRFYWPVLQWLTGFGVMAAFPTSEGNARG